MGEDGKGLALNTPGVEEMCSARGKTILAFLKSMDKKWDGEASGVKDYLTKEIGLSEEDLVKIRQKFLGGDSQKYDIEIEGAFLVMDNREGPLVVCPVFFLPSKHFLKNTSS